MAVVERLVEDLLLDVRFRRREKYCHNGGMAFAHDHAPACLGVHDGDHGPFRRSP
jgi:hypothetical protein